MKHTSKSAAEAGFSLLEGLIGSALLLAIVIGVLPLFTAAMVNNAAGREGTQAANIAADGLEKTWQLPWDSPDVSFPAAVGNRKIELLTGKGGSKTMAIFPANAANPEDVQPGDLGTNPITEDYWKVATENFTPAQRATASWGRITTMRQYSLASIADADNGGDGIMQLDEALDAGIGREFVHFKLAEVNVVNLRRAADPDSGDEGSFLAPPSQFTVRLLKAF